MTWTRPPARVKQYEGKRPDAPRSPLPAVRIFDDFGGDPCLKPSTHESEAWRRAVASLDCVLCGRSGDTQCAHRNEGKGMGLKTDDALTAALCTNCHSDIDQGKSLTREDRRERMDRAILLTIQALARAGKLKATP